jgi:iron complex transport system ATP-binding protein
VLAILHDINLAAQYADTLVVLKDGRIAAQGSPSQVLCPTVIEEVFGVSATRLDAAGRPVIVSAAAFHSQNGEGPRPVRSARHAHVPAEHKVRTAQAEV